MKNNQKGFIIPLVLAIIAVVAIGAGVYYYQKSQNLQTSLTAVETSNTPTTNSTSTNQTATTTAGNTKSTTTQSSSTASNKTLTDDQIAKVISSEYGVTLTKQSDGSYASSVDPNRDNGPTEVDILNISKGDLNNDGYQDAIVNVDHCGASCGQTIEAILNIKGNPQTPLDVSPGDGDFLLGSAAQVEVKNITLNKGNVAITVDDPVSNSIKTFNYTFKNNMLIRANFQTQ